MVKKLRLVALIMDAHFIAMNGIEVDKIKQMPDGVQVSLADETYRTFREQEVELDEDGAVDVIDVQGDLVSCVFQSKVPYKPSEDVEPRRIEEGDEGKMKVSLDGGLSFVDAAQGVRVVYEGIDVPGEDGKGELHVTLSREGFVRDVWVTREEPLDHNMGTDSQTVEEAVSAMVEEGS